jgi:hypothetical protein
MKSTGLQLVVQGDRDRMDGRSLVPQPDVAALLTDYHILQALQRESDDPRIHRAATSCGFDWD